MPAGVREAAQRAVGTSDEQHALVADPYRALIARVRELVSAPDAQPRALQEVALLPREDALVEVRVGRERAALTERGIDVLLIRGGRARMSARRG
jgi:hypothetical protein